MCSATSSSYAPETHLGSSVCSNGGTGSPCCLTPAPLSRAASLCSFRDKCPPGGQAVLYRYGQGPCAPPLQAPIEDCILSAVGTVVVQPGSMHTGRARLAHGGAVSARVGTRGTASGTPLPP